MLYVISMIFNFFSPKIKGKTTINQSKNKHIHIYTYIILYIIFCPFYIYVRSQLSALFTHTICIIQINPKHPQSCIKQATLVLCVDILKSLQENWNLTLILNLRLRSHKLLSIFSTIIQVR